MATSSKKIIAWHTNIVPRSTKKALDFLSQATWLKKTEWYLAGGTALALQVGHRTSVDLDFFIKGSFNNISVLRCFLNNKNWTTTINEEGTVYGELFKAKISFIAYPFFYPKWPLRYYGAVRILSPLDIAVMKIIAISQRGRKRDFFDLYWCAKNLESLETIMPRLRNQYPSVAHDYHHILKSLVYFNDAEPDPMPAIHFKAKWSEVKTFFQREVINLSKRIL